MAGLFVPNMTPEQIANARKWIAALRSGKYQQGQGQLCYIEGARRWCCLGVGSDVVGLRPPGTRAYLSCAEATALGLSTQAGNFHGNLPGFPGYISLDTLNDNGGRSFPQIADVIEAELALVTEGTA